MSDKMTDAEVRAELERIDPHHTTVYPLYEVLQEERVNPQQIMTLKALRLLAESQWALGEIADQHHLDDCEPFYGGCACAERIARKHWKGGKP